MKMNRTSRPAAIVLAATVGALAAALSHGQASPASSAQVAPGVIRPGSTADEAGMTQRPTGIDAEFVDKAGMIGKVEQQASQLALDRSSNPAVKAFARRMVDDHGRIAGELRRLGAAKGVPVQSRMLVDPAVTALRIREGHAFDAAYVALAGPRAHEAAIRLYDAEARNGRDPQLRAFAANALPMLNAHLAAARRLEQTVAAAH
jgi:putative membrane protein